MPATYAFPNRICVEADGPVRGFYTFQITFPDGIEAFYRRDHKQWFFLDEVNWFPIHPNKVPSQVRQARVKYGSGDF